MEDHKSERVIRARLTVDLVEHVFIDLSSACFEFRRRLALASDEGQLDHMVYVDVMAMVTMLAFTLEGYANFIGDYLLKQSANETIGKIAWEHFERKDVIWKIKTILKLTETTADWNKRPYSTVAELMKLRKVMAHPKTHRIQKQFEATGRESELRQSLRDEIPEHTRMLTPAFAIDTYDDVNCIWEDMMKTARLEQHNAFGGGSAGIEFLHYIEENEL